MGADGGKLDGDTRIVTMFRGERMIAVRPDTGLRAGDRLILPGTAAGLERLKPHVDGL